MTKIASKPTTQTSAPAKSNTGTGTTKTTPKSDPIKSGAADTAKISKEASGAGASSGVGGLISGLMNWGGYEGEDTAKGAKEVAKPLELDKGQTLRSGASGDKVTQLQEMLNSKGAKIDVDGKFGPKTMEALKKFQGDNELKTDGVVGPDTLGRLNGPDGKQEQKVEETKTADQSKGTGKTDQQNSDKKTAETGEAKGPNPLQLGEGELLRKGASGDKVKQLQELLNSKGAKLEVDGKFGSGTLEALKKFQGDNELKADGVVGSNTLGKLNGAEGAQKPADAQGADQPKPVDQAQGGDGRFGNTREALDKLPGPLQKYADVFQAAGEKYGVDPRFLAAISMHETGNGTSSAFRNKNNAMGISGKGGPKHISSVERSIELMAQTLAKKDGYYKGKNTIGAIGKTYAPSGAANDPTGLNAYWAGGVAKNYKMVGGDPLGQVVFR